MAKGLKLFYRLFGNNVRLSLKEADKYILYHSRADQERIISAILNGKSSLTFSKDEVARWKKEKAVRDEQDRILRQAVDLNHKGISLEKEGKIEDAIKVYEENIAIGYPAKHSYNRLMIIYRRIKDYENEERIISKAIDVFSLENERRFLKALDGLINPQHIEKLNLAHQRNDKFRPVGSQYFIYAPYPVNKFIDRLEKCRRLQCQ